MGVLCPHGVCRVNCQCEAFRTARFQVPQSDNPQGGGRLGVHVLTMNNKYLYPGAIVTRTSGGTGCMKVTELLSNNRVYVTGLTPGKRSEWEEYSSELRFATQEEINAEKS